MSSKRILFDDGANAANRNLANVQTKYVNLVSAVAATISSFNIGVPTREMVYDAIYKNGNMVHDALLAKAVMPQDESLADIVMSKIANEMANICVLAEKITRSSEIIFNGQSVKNPKLFDWIEIDANGYVKLSESAVAMIREYSRIYITTEIGIKLYGLQQTIVECTQEIHDALQNVLESGYELHPSARFTYFNPSNGLFRAKIDHETNRTIIEPLHINFDPQAPEEVVSLED